MVTKKSTQGTRGTGGRVQLKAGELEFAAHLIELRVIPMNQVNRHILDLAILRRRGKRFRLADVETRMIREITSQFDFDGLEEEMKQEKKAARDFTENENYVGDHAWDYK